MLLAGGPVTTIADGLVGEGLTQASWGTDDSIVVAPAAISGLFRVSAAGGVPEPLTTPAAERGEVSHQNPEMLPGGRAVLLTVRYGMSPDASRIEVLSLDTGERHLVVDDAINARYAQTGHIVYAGSGSLAGSLWMVPFETATLEATGPPVRVVEALQLCADLTACFTLSASGTLVYVPASPDPHRLVWVEPSGQTTTLLDTPGFLRFPRLSPDGERVAVTINDEGDIDIWVLELARGALSRFTTDGATITSRSGPPMGAGSRSALAATVR